MLTSGEPPASWTCQNRGKARRRGRCDNCDTGRLFGFGVLYGKYLRRYPHNGPIFGCTWEVDGGVSKQSSFAKEVNVTVGLLPTTGTS